MATDFSAETLAALVDASAAINSAQDIDDTLAAIARAAAAVMRAEASSVIMLDRARSKQVFRAAVGDSANRVMALEYDIGAGISGKVLRTSEAAIVNDVSIDDAHLEAIDDAVGFKTRSLIAAPLVNNDETLGVVEVLNPLDGGNFGEKDLQIARMFANLAAIAVANSRLTDRLRRDNRGLRHSLRSQTDMIGISPAIEEVRDLIARVARSTATVLLLGDTGTGKEVAARLIHAGSPRADRPFIAVNCAALPKTLLESELFGHEAGAFTGATGRKLGRFELADEGTIFLDEVTEVTPDVQVKLLRVLQEREIIRVGGIAPIGCDARVIAATNRDLADEMRRGRFREDLFYRLNVFPIEVPPLRRRTEDVPLLAEHCLKRLAAEMKMPMPTISPEAVAALSQYAFPGNVRELQNILERACLLCTDGDESADHRPTIGIEHLPRGLAEHGAGSAQPESGSALAAGEKAMIVNALRENDWNQSKAARALGISRDNIRYRIRKYGIERPR